jgi:hypothetical protein
MSRRIYRQLPFETSTAFRLIDDKKAGRGSLREELEDWGEEEKIRYMEVLGWTLCVYYASQLLYTYPPFCPSSIATEEASPRMEMELIVLQGIDNVRDGRESLGRLGPASSRVQASPGHMQPAPIFTHFPVRRRRHLRHRRMSC